MHHAFILNLPRKCASDHIPVTHVGPSHRGATEKHAEESAPAGHAGASIAVSSGGRTGQPGPAPCVAVYTA